MSLHPLANPSQTQKATRVPLPAKAPENVAGAVEVGDLEVDVPGLVP